MERITNSQESKTFVVPQFIFEAACEAGKKSPCRSQRGVVLWDGFGIVSVGYNHLQLAACDHSDACKAVCGKLALHAEEHAIATATRPTASASMFPVKIVDGQPVASGAPSCIRCSNQILAHGMAHMWLLDEDGLRRYSAEQFHQKTIVNLFGGSPSDTAI